MNPTADPAATDDAPSTEPEREPESRPAQQPEPQPGDPRRAERPPTHILGVRFRRAGRIYYFNGHRTPDVAVGDRVVVQTARGREIGSVAIATDQVVGASLRDLKPVQRRATVEDLAAQDSLRALEDEALAAARDQIREQRLPMKPVLAEYTFDRSRVTIYFVSEQQRVDFRALVRELARILRTRVLLRQVGPRDQAKLLGGIDRCGRELCCSSWMTDFQPISIRMAKHQHLPLNPSEISGVCGKLLCCLAFEDTQYREMRTGLPKVGARLTSAVGAGRVIDVNVLTRRILIVWETGARLEIDADEFLEQQEIARRTGMAPDFGAGAAASPSSRFGAAAAPPAAGSPAAPAPSGPRPAAPPPARPAASRPVEPDRSSDASTGSEDEARRRRGRRRRGRGRDGASAPR